MAVLVSNSATLIWIIRSIVTTKTATHDNTTLEVVYNIQSTAGAAVFVNIEMSNLPGFEDLVECPYNKSHQILRSRIQTHLVKCRKNHPNSGKRTCLFNVTHIINKEEFDVGYLFYFFLHISIWYFIFIFFN